MKPGLRVCIIFVIVNSRNAIVVFSNKIFLVSPDGYYFSTSDLSNTSLFLFLCVLIKGTIAAKSLQSCPTLCDPMDCSLPGFSVHGILQARTLKWVAISFSKGTIRHCLL